MISESAFIKAVLRVAKRARLDLPENSYSQCSDFSTAAVFLAQEAGLDAELFAVDMRYERDIGLQRKGDIEGHVYFRLGRRYYDFTVSQFGKAGEAYVVRSFPYPRSEKERDPADEYHFWYEKIKGELASEVTTAVLAVAREMEVTRSEVWDAIAPDVGFLNRGCRRQAGQRACYS